MKDQFIRISLLATAIIHLLPTLGVFGPEKLNQLYGAYVSDPNLLLLLRHRAVLFFILGLFFLLSVFVDQIRLLAYAMGFLAMGSFIFLCFLQGESNDFLKRVFWIDLVTLIILLFSSTLDCFGIQKFMELLKK